MKRSATGRRSGLAALALLALGIAGCGGDGPATPVSIAQACAPGQDGQVAVVGYLRLPSTVTLGESAVIDLFTERGGEGARVAIELSVGTGPNQLRDLPSQYSPTSLRVGTATEDATIIDQVNVVARVTRDEGACRLTDPTIEIAG